VAILKNRYQQWHVTADKKEIKISLNCFWLFILESLYEITCSIIYENKELILTKHRSYLSSQ